MLSSCVQVNINGECKPHYRMCILQTAFWKVKMVNFCLFIIEVPRVVNPCRELESMTTVNQVATAMSTIAANQPINAIVCLLVCTL